MASKLKGSLDKLLDLLFPPRCLSCGWRGVWLCATCTARIPRLPASVCRFCGRPTSGTITCPDCWRGRPATEGVYSPYFFEEPLRPLIHRFKYRNARHLAKDLALLLLPSSDRIPRVDLVVPVPLHPARLKQRGYNQSGLLADELGRALDLPVVHDCLCRRRDTPPQMSLPAAERRRNVKGAFGCVSSMPASCRVLIVDDVCTTGATLDACAASLKRAGASFVAGVTIARAR